MRAAAPTIRHHKPGELPELVWDVVVVGSGPAGAIAARRVAQAGYRALLLERRRFPRDKACGDALIPDAIASLRRNGLYARIARLSHTASAARIFSPSRIDFAVRGEFLTLKRLVFDAELAAAAVESGAVLCHATASAVDDWRDGAATVAVEGERRPIAARVVVLATGATTALARTAGMVTRPRASATALRTYVRSRADLPELVASYDRSILPGYAWIFPMGDGEYNVGCGTIVDDEGQSRDNLRELLDRFLHHFPLASTLRAKQEGESTPLRGAPLRCGFTGCVPYNGRRTLAVGETLGATFPFTGEGIGKAMESAEIASDVVCDAVRSDRMDVLATYDERLERTIRPKYRGYEIAETWLARGWVNDFVARRARRSRYLRDALGGVLSETVDPKDVFSLKGMVRSLVG